MCAILIKSVLLFISCILFQILIWRLIPERPRHALNFFKALPWLFVIFFGVGGLSGFWMAGIPILDSALYSIAAQFSAIMFFHSFASLIYILACTALAAFSPSMELLKIVEGNMPGGIARSAVEVPLMTAVLFEERYQNMLSTKMIVEKDKRFGLAWRGRLVASIFLSYRRLLGIAGEKGG